ncbi:hypothetical protein ANTQUA_LOCUS8824 [Anthophora quadrimaculata]
MSSRSNELHILRILDKLKAAFDTSIPNGKNDNDVRETTPGSPYLTLLRAAGVFEEEASPRDRYIYVGEYVSATFFAEHIAAGCCGIRLRAPFIFAAGRMSGLDRSQIAFAIIEGSKLVKQLLVNE